MLIPPPKISVAVNKSSSALRLHLDNTSHTLLSGDSLKNARLAALLAPQAWLANAVCKSSFRLTAMREMQFEIARWQRVATVASQTFKSVQISSAF